MGILDRLLDGLLGLETEEYIPLTCSQEQRVRGLLKQDDGIRIDSNFRVISLGVGPRLMYVKYKGIYSCTIGGDVFKRTFDKKDYEKIKWLDDRLREIFEDKE